MKPLMERTAGKIIYSPLTTTSEARKFHVLMLNERNKKCECGCKDCDCNREIWNCLILEPWHVNFLGVVAFCMTPAIWSEDDYDTPNQD